MRFLLPLFVVGFGALPRSAAAQDVEWLGERYGTRPPASYFAEKGRAERAFEFSRGRSLRLELRRSLDARAGARAGGGPALALGPRTGPVTGTYRVPVLLGLYENSPPSPPFDRVAIENAYFGGQVGSITDYYTEASGGRVTLEGDLFDWRQISQPDSLINDGQSGLFSASVGGGGAGNFVYELLSLQSGIDWGLYDNDGPDGVPNSGDDDGFVDVVSVIHPTRGGECGGSGSGDRIWSHRWSLSSAVLTPFETSTPSANGGFIQVDDYTVQPSMPCSGAGLNPIGVFTHELGHAFGLPDLYDTDSSDGTHQGVGNWDLMASGAWGCDNQSPDTPCHMGAWSKEQLGWADVITLAPDTDHGVLTLPPVEAGAGVIWRIDANDGSGEYFLLENRQRVDYDQNLRAEGLLVWQIDPDWIASRWPANEVNASDHLGVWLRQADGLDELGQSGGGRGDAGDPFPGSTGNTAFHGASTPDASSYLGGPSGVTLIDIEQVGSDVRLRVSTRFTTVTVRANGSASPNGIFTVDGAPTDPPNTTFSSAPFVPHTVEAVAGEDVAPGERRPFLEWSDTPTEPRLRTLVTPLVDTELVAEYGGSQYLLDLTSTGGVGGIEPADFVTSPATLDFWFDGGTNVTLEAVPLTGFAFLGWTGGLAGRPNPTTVAMSAPLSGGADFELVYAVSAATVPATATVEQDIQLETVNGTGPYSWRIVDGTLPQGLRMSGTGRITGRALDLGTVTVDVEALDANGLPATGTVVFELAAPSIPIEALVAPFLLSGPPLTPAQLAFLDYQGNQAAGYDVGDFRAWLLANPSLPLSATFEREPGPVQVVVPMRPSGGARR